MSTFLDASYSLRYDSPVSNSLSRNQLVVLIFGDAIFLLAVTFLGFATHYRSLSGWRWLATFLPLLVSWYPAAYLLGLYRTGTVDRYGMIWLVLAASVYAAPLAVTLRALWLQQTVIPIFGLVMISMTAVGMGIWRLAWVAWTARRSGLYG